MFTLFLINFLILFLLLHLFFSLLDGPTQMSCFCLVEHYIAFVASNCIDEFLKKDLKPKPKQNLYELPAPTSGSELRLEAGSVG